MQDQDVPAAASALRAAVARGDANQALAIVRQADEWGLITPELQILKCAAHALCADYAAMERACDIGIEAFGNLPPLLLNRGIALYRQGRVDAARAVWRAIITQPDAPLEVILHWAALEIENDQAEVALTVAEQGLVHHAQATELHFLRANALLELGRSADASRLYTHLLADTADPRAALGGLYAQLKLNRIVDSAVFAHRLPADWWDSDLLSDVYERLAPGDERPPPEGLKTFLKAMPTEAAGTLALLLARYILSQGWSIDTCQRWSDAFISVEPTAMVGSGLFAVACARSGQYARADGLLATVRAVDPTIVDQLTGKGTRAPAEIYHSLHAQWSAVDLHIQWMIARHLGGLWLSDDELRRWLDTALVRLGETGVPMIAAHDTVFLPLSAEERQRVARGYARHLRTAAGEPLPTREAAAHGQLRIGYLSGDFRNHPTAHLTQDLYANHDRRRFQVFIYSLCAAPDDPYQQKIAAGGDYFIDASGMSHLALAQRIRSDGIDVLVDLAGYTAFGRPEVLALKPAPIQVSYLGYPGTLGPGIADYVIVDNHLLSEREARHLDESPVYLPVCYQANTTQRISAETTTRAQHGLPNDAVVLCAFHNHKKVNPQSWRLWLRLLLDCPNTVLWLMEPPTALRAMLTGTADRAGVTAARLIFAPRTGKAEHLERLRHADVFLDSLICCAHTTATDALLAGVPIITLEGVDWPSRVTTSVLRHAGLGQLIAQTADEYVRMVCELVDVPPRREALRQQIMSGEAQRLYDSVHHTRRLEEAYESMWRDRPASR